tara:strand:- start:77 stop:640 length:564 start_codon:yes stop_codon:yes gene_type:complete
MATLFISASRLKTNTALSGSVDDNLLHPYILRAQDTKILPVLGTDLYNKLISDIGGTPSGIYKTILDDYIAPCLVQFSFAELLPVLRLRFVNNSIQLQNSEQGSGASYEDIKPIMQNAIDAGQFYRERLIDYLEYNSNSISEYTSNSGSDLSPTSRNYYAGLNLDTNISTSNELKNFIQGANIKNIC